MALTFPRGRPLPGSERESETDLGDLVMRVARGLRQRGAAVTAPWDLAPHQARALRVVARHGQVRPGRIAATCAWPPAR